MLEGAARTGQPRKDGTVRVEGKLYEVDLSLRALQVELRFDPFSMKRIEVTSPQPRLRAGPLGQSAPQ